MEISASRIFFRYIPAIYDLEILHKSHWAQGTQISLISLYFNETSNNVISTVFSPPVPIGVYLSIDRFITGYYEVIIFIRLDWNHQSSMMEAVSGNSSWLEGVNYFRKRAPSWMF